jgi:ATP-dependent DNA helicase RecQ
MSESNIHEILKHYWGYSRFRPLQEDIINSVLAGNDTLALLSTGGGKSVCFQVPGLVLPGITLVITPLIALMKDQVEHLRKSGINAEAIYSGMSPREFELAVNHIQFQHSKFLYLSPERLASGYFREILSHLSVDLIVVDEAHCISQWGYDFRPSYLRISEIRPYFPGVPVLALTATATEEVAADIQKQLGFREGKVFIGNFERPNLAYVVEKDENKNGKLLRVLKGVPGSGIVYVRNRKKTQETARFLQSNNISADYYHAGLSPAEREKRQDEWLNGYTRVIVCTNAFGMGIDKPDVRSVVHLDFPDSVEAYYQEAGRAGRDGKKSYNVLIYDDADLLDAEANININYPTLDFIKIVYRAVGNYCRLVPGTGQDLSVDFDLADFANQYNFKPLLAFNALKFIEKEGYISMNEAMYSSSRFIFIASRDDLYRFQVENPDYDVLIKTMQRSYGGSFTEPVAVNEAEMARRLNTSEDLIRKMLQQLHNLEILSYFPLSDKPQLTFVSELVKAEDLTISPENYEVRKKLAEQRMKAVISYAQSNECRSRFLINYFNQKADKCGVCDVCIETNKKILSEKDFNEVVDVLKPLLQINRLNLQQVIEACETIPQEKVVLALNWLIENNKIKIGDDKTYSWN